MTVPVQSPKSKTRLVGGAFKYVKGRAQKWGLDGVMVWQGQLG